MTFARKIAEYGVGRALPGVLAFVMVATLTHLLGPRAYGEYALAISGAAFANTILFQWLHLSALRYVSGAAAATPIIRAVFRGYVCMAAIAVAVLGLGALVVPDRNTARIIALGTIVLLAQAWYELNLQVTVARLQSGAFVSMSVARSTVAFLASAGAAVAGFGPAGVLAGAALGYVAASLVVSAGAVREVRRDYRDPQQPLRDLAAYGIPLTGTFVLDVVVNSSDRFFLGRLAGLAPAGQYSAAYDITQQSLGMVFLTINLAAYPMAVRLFDRGGLPAARDQLSSQVSMLAGVAIPAAVGLSILAPNLATTVLGPGFASMGSVMPVVALAAFIAGMKAFYFDMPFQLTRKPEQLVVIMAIAAIVNVVLNALLIPSIGALGAAWSTVAAYAVACVSSVSYGRRLVVMPMPWPRIGRIAAGSAVMGISLLTVRAARGPVALAGQVALGALVYLIAIAALHKSAIRAWAAGRAAAGTGSAGAQ